MGLRVNAIRFFPMLHSFNGREIDEVERIAASKIFEPLDRITCAENVVCPPGCRLELQSRQINTIVDGLISHAYSVDEKVRVVHEHFEAIVREVIQEAWDDVL